MDDQIQVAMAVDVSETRPGRVQFRTGHPGGGGNVLESPIPQVAVEHVQPIQSAEVKITQTVAIHVTGGHARAIEKYRIGEITLRREVIGKGNTSGLRWQEGEAGLPRRRHRQLPPATAGLRLPI